MSRRKSLTAQPKPRQRNWRDYSDAMYRSFNSWPNPESLHPDADTVFNAVCGNPSSRSIVESYAFRFPVTVVTEVLN